MNSPQLRRLIRLALSTALSIGWNVPAVATSQSPSARFESLRGQDLRVASVAYRLSLANSAECGGSLAPQHGLILHGIEQYGAGDREEAARHFGLSSGVSIMATVEDSPAAVAGLSAGDRLLSINGEPAAIADAPLKSQPSRESVQHVQKLLAKAMSKGEVLLRVDGAQGERDVRFRAKSGCPADVELLSSKDVNAWADGDRVIVSAGILRRCTSDDDLALIIAHELAHNFLRHGSPTLDPATRQGARFMPTHSAASGTQEAEEEADRLAVKLTRAAGYDLNGAESLLTGLTAISPPAPGVETHPPLERRLRLLRVEIAASGG